MRLADALFDWLYQKGVSTVFMLPGGGCMHLCDALGRHEGLEYIVMQHEQAAAIAAESWGQHTNMPGVALVTSGPGVTNAITGVAAAWIDSTPCIIISGQCKTADSMDGRGVRQMGSQEVDAISIVKPITKYAAQIRSAQEFWPCLKAAWHEATTGRKGPVWLSIPLDIQASEVGPPEEAKREMSLRQMPDLACAEKILREAERPLILAGNGLKLAGVAEQAKKWAEQNGIPVISTWKMLDFMPFEHPLFFGCPGGMGHRYANFILQSCDALLVLGSRLDTSITAFNQPNFAPHARKIIIDIDEREIAKLEFDCVRVQADIADIMQELGRIDIAVNEEWTAYCREMRRRFPVVLPKYDIQETLVNPYVFVKKLSRHMSEGDVLTPESSGGAGEITYQAFEAKHGQKIKNAAGLGSMGFGLPYAIAACLANGKRRTVLLNGDGAFQLNVQELETLRRLDLPVKIFIWENGGYSSIRNTQKNLCGGFLVASDPHSGYTLPNISAVAVAYGIPVCEMSRNSEIDGRLSEMLEAPGPALCIVHIPEDQVTAPRVMSRRLTDGSIVSAALEDMWPHLSEEEKKKCLPWN